MNLSHFALLLTAGLLAFTTYLSLQSRKSTNKRFDELAQRIDDVNKKSEEETAAERKQFELELEAMRKQNEELAKQNVRIAEEKAAVEKENAIVAETAKTAIEAASAPEAPAVELTPQQQKIRDAASIAEVTDYREDFGFVVLNRGTKNGLTPGMKFAVRRDYFIVGRIKVDSVEDNEAIANVAASSIPVGFTIRKGDAVIMGEDAGIY